MSDDTQENIAPLEVGATEEAEVADAPATGSEENNG